MLRSTLLCLMFTFSEEVIDQQIVESLSYRLGIQIRKCFAQLEMDETDFERWTIFWSDEFDFDVWYDGCLAQCVLQRQGLIDRYGNFNQHLGIAFAESCGADDEQTQELLAMLTTKCVISELMSELPDVNQPHHCVRPMLAAICFRRGILESMQPEDRRRRYGYNPTLSPWEKLYSKLSQLYTF